MKLALPPGIFNPNRPFQPSRSRIFYGWIIAFAGTVGIICSIPGQTMGVSVFTDRLIDSLEVKRTWISFAYLVGTIISGFLVSPMGRWLDRHGLRHGAVISGFGIGAALIFLSQVDRIAAGISSIFPTTWELGFKVLAVTIGFFLLRFFGQGLMTLASRNMIAKWFDEFRGRVTAISGIAASFAFSVTPLFFDWLIVGIGWRMTWLSLALFCGLFFALFAWLFFRDNPEECGLLMDGGVKPKEGRRINQDNRVVRQFTKSEAIRTYGFWIYNLALSFQGFFITGYTFHILSIADDLDLTREAVLGAFFPGAVLAIFISLLVGWLIDRTRLKYGLVVFCVGVTLIPSGLLLAPHSYSIWVLIAGLGLAGGSFAPVIGTVWARFFGRRELGAISGLNMSSLVIGSALGPIVFSLSYDHLGGYRPAIVLGVVCGVLLIFGSLFAGNPQRKLQIEEGNDV